MKSFEIGYCITHFRPLFHRVSLEGIAVVPLYDFECLKGHRFERMIPLREFEALVYCDCQTLAKRLISTPMFSVEQVGYDCPVTGRWIGSKREHRENLARTDSRVLESGEMEANQARKKQEEARFDRMIEETVEREIDSMDCGKKETLHNELVNGGLSADVVRK